MLDRLLDIASLALFALGALTFSALALFYWHERRGGKPRERTVLPLFTVVCAVAFLANLLSEVLSPPMAGSRLAIGIAVAGALSLGLLPPLVVHLVLETRRGGTDGGGRPRALAVFYAASVAVVAVRLLDPAGAGTRWAGVLDRAPAVALGIASALGLLFLGRSADRGSTRWMRLLLGLMLVCALASLANLRYVDQLADYLLLAFFCVCLYYQERLVFFDVLMKRGVFLALGLAAITAAVVIATWPLVSVPRDAFAWLCGFVGLWLAGPFVHERVARAIDRAWLHRPYSAVEAEREFIRDVQSAAGEEQLQAAATGSLEKIFQAPVTMRFGAAGPAANLPEESVTAEIRDAASTLGFIGLSPRPNGVPFLSDDRRLLHVLAGTLGMLLENVRFRADRRRQEQREQQLRLLASRAELKALRAQINPHFLFNALSVIAGLTQYQPELADEIIDRLAQVFRYTLRQSEHEWTPLGEEVAFVAAYLRIEQVRFGDRLRVELEIDPAVDGIPIPAMSIQPLIENAIRHGVSAREEPGTVGLRAALADGRLRIEVFDTGPGFPPGFSLREPGESRGLRNIAERLRGYYGDAARLSWENGGSHTRVMLEFPLSAVSCAAGGEQA